MSRPSRFVAVRADFLAAQIGLVAAQADFLAVQIRFQVLQRRPGTLGSDFGQIFGGRTLEKHQKVLYCHQKSRFS